MIRLAIAVADLWLSEREKVEAGRSLHLAFCGSREHAFWGRQAAFACRVPLLQLHSVSPGTLERHTSNAGDLEVWCVRRRVNFRALGEGATVNDEFFRQLDHVLMWFYDDMCLAGADVHCGNYLFAAMTFLFHC